MYYNHSTRSFSCCAFQCVYNLLLLIQLITFTVSFPNVNATIITFILKFYRMILRKIKGPQFFTPIGKIKLEWLHEQLIFTILNHALAKDFWSEIGTTNVQVCLEFLMEHLQITTSPLCTELQYYLETCIAVINLKSYKKIMSKHFKLFEQILHNLQLNDNNAIISKCTIYKLPYNTPFVLPHKITTYYIFIEIIKFTNDHKSINKFLENKLANCKYFKPSILSSYSFSKIKGRKYKLQRFFIH